MRRLVVDTSTLIGAVLHAHSVPHRAWLRAQSGFKILASPATLSELETVLHRPRLARFLDPITRDDFLTIFRATVECIDVTPGRPVEPPCRDPKDNAFLALAQIGNADLILASDHDLLVLHPWNGIPILTPAQFLSQSEE